MNDNKKSVLRYLKKPFLIIAFCIVAGVTYTINSTPNLPPGIEVDKSVLIISNSSALLKDAPSPAANTLDRLKRGEKFIYLSDDHPWIKIKSSENSKTGWVHITNIDLESLKNK